MTSLSTFFDHANPVEDPLWRDLVDMIRYRYANTPRHLQRELGPSEVGHPCPRKLAYGLMEVPRCNPEWDPLPSIIGTAMHTWLQDAAELQNEHLGRQRWITETKVHVVPGLSGSADLYDTDTDTVIDWKNLGYTSYVKYMKDIGPTYRAQGHMYGKGFVNAGYPVKRVSVAILPRTGTLTRMHLHTEDYDEDLVNAVLTRRDSIITLLDEFDIENNPERYQWIANEPYECIWCPWWRPEAKGPLQCNGKK